MGTHVHQGNLAANSFKEVSGEFLTTDLVMTDTTVSPSSTINIELSSITNDEYKFIHIRYIATATGGAFEGGVIYIASDDGTPKIIHQRTDNVSGIVLSANIDSETIRLSVQNVSASKTLEFSYSKQVVTKTVMST